MQHHESTSLLINQTMEDKIDSYETKDLKGLKELDTGFYIRNAAGLVIMALSYIMCSFQKMCPSIVIGDMSKDYGVDVADLDIFTPIYWYAYGVVQIFAGLLADTFEPSFLLCGSMTLAGIGSIIIGASKSLSLGVFARLIIGLGCGPVYVVITRYNANWFNLKYYGVMEGIFLAIGCCGAILAQSPLASMCNAVGWRNSFYIIGGMTLFFALLSIFFVRGSPTKFGYRHVNKQMEEVVTHDTFIQKLIQLKDNLIVVIKYPWYWLPCMFIVLSVPPYYTTAGMWASPYLRDIFGMSNVQAGSMLTCITVGVLLSDLITPWISNFVKSRKWVCASLSFLAVMISVWGYVRVDKMSTSEIGGLFFLYGCLTMPSFCICSPLFREYYHPQVSATAIGLANSLDCISSGLFQMFVSWIIQQYGKQPGTDKYTVEGYRAGLWLFTIIIDSVAFLFIAFAKETPFFKTQNQDESIELSDECNKEQIEIISESKEDEDALEQKESTSKSNEESSGSASSSKSSSSRSSRSSSSPPVENL